MTTTDTFLQAILDDPDDDSVRLIYADWLDERGDAESAARAEFIRVQCALVRQASLDERRRLVERELLLLRTHAAEWLRPLRQYSAEGIFHRGFLYSVRLSMSDFLAGADELFRLAPIQDVHLYATQDELPKCRLLLPQLAACPDLVRLTALNLCRTLLDSHAIEALAVSEYLTRLEDLNLSDNRIGDGGLRALASAPFFRRLSRLDLSDNQVGPAGVRALLAEMRLLESAGRSPLLRDLDLRGNPLGAAGLRAINSSPLLARVTQW
jgi:uncharacterized protein (TIGR02996 family)